MKALKRDIEKQRAKLKAKVMKKGLHENFGQKEVMKLEDKHLTHYSEDMNDKRREIEGFEDWCMDYCG